MKEIELKINQIERRDEQHFAELKNRTIGLFIKCPYSRYFSEKAIIASVSVTILIVRKA